jgi:hypothetical protein
MSVIHIYANGRGHAIGLPGFWRALTTDEERAIATAAWGTAQTWNDRQWDVAKAMCTDGAVTSAVDVELATITAKFTDVAKAVALETVRRQVSAIEQGVARIVTKLGA